MVTTCWLYPVPHDLTTNVNWTFVQEFGRQVGLETIDLKSQNGFCSMKAS